MSDPRLRQVVDKVMQSARSLQDLFLLNYRDEANRPKLQSGFETDGNLIQRNLKVLIRETQLKSALDTPNAAYNQFISAWNNGTGDLLVSFNRITEFWRLLQAAQPQLDRLMAPQPGPGPQPTPGHRGTPAEVAVFTRLRSETAELYRVFDAYVKKQPALKSRIQEHVRVIGEVLNDSRLGHDAQTLLITSQNSVGKVH